eukprot:gene22539-23732_t
MAIVLDETSAEACIEALANADRLQMSAATLAEALIVADRRGVRSEVAELVAGLRIEVVPVTAAAAERIADAYARWGKGLHPASLNFGDCFAYDLAIQRSCPLLYVGRDFVQTDVRSAI